MLTIDIGNTNIKWALWDGEAIIRSGAFAYSKQQVQQAFHHWHELHPEQQVMVACVAGEDVETALTDWMRRHWSQTPVFLRSAACFGDVINAYPDPAQYGVDRWATLLGARALTHQPLCIIDAGTAITVDLIDVDGRHQGGLIMPGLQMMRQALLSGAAGIDKANGNIRAFADNTADAVSSGTLHMLKAAIIDVCSSAAKVLGTNMKIIITGGTSELILSLPGIPEMQSEPNLVLLGLRVAAQSQTS
jgi:type III pantothenate kinase